MHEERQALPNAHLERSGRRLRTLPGTARAFAAAAGCHCPLAGVLLVPCSRSLRPRLLPVPRSFLSTVDGVILLKVNVPPSLLRSKIISLRAMVSHLVTMEAQTLAASSEARLGRPCYLLVCPAAPLPTTPRPGRLALPRPRRALSSRCPCTCALRLGRLCQRPRITLGPPCPSLLKQHLLSSAPSGHCTGDGICLPHPQLPGALAHPTCALSCSIQGLPTC